MLIELSVSNLIPQEMITCCDQIVTASMSSTDPVLGRRIEALTMYSDLMTDAIKRGKKSEFTPVLSQMDELRDNGFKSFFHGVMSAVFSSNVEISAAGKKLKEIIERHDTAIHRLGYMAQTAEMKSLKQEIDKTPELVDKALVDRQYEEMKESMAAFDLVRSQKTESEDKEKAPGITICKKLLGRQLNLFFYQVSLMVEDKVEGVDSLVNKYNEIISSTMAIARARQTRQQNSGGAVSGGEEDDSSDVEQGIPPA